MALSSFVVMMTVSCIAQSYPVSVYETDTRSGISSAALASGSGRTFKASQDRTIPDLNTLRNPSKGCSHEVVNRRSLEALGPSYAQQLEKTSKLVTDPVVTDYVNRIGQNLAHSSDAQIHVTLKVIDRNEVNAVVLPGGLIFIDSGLIAAADNEAELAGVISHEIAHVVGCHPEQEMEYAELASPTSMPLIYRLIFHGFSINTIHSNHARSFEFEADSVGVNYLYKAGYDPQAFLTMLEKVWAIDKQKPGKRSNVLVARMLTIDRIARARQKINSLPVSAHEYRLDTTDFQKIKQRLSKPR